MNKRPQVKQFGNVYPRWKEIKDFGEPVSQMVSVPIPRKWWQFWKKQEHRLYITTGSAMYVLEEKDT